MQSQRNGQQAEVIGLDIGNSYIRIVLNSKLISLRNNLYLQKNSASLNKPMTPESIIDFIFLVDSKIDDASSYHIGKYYNYTFRKGMNRNVIAKMPLSSIDGESYLQLYIALILKGVFVTQAFTKYLLSSKKQIKVVATVFEGQLNSYRISLKKCFKLIGINDYCFVNVNNCIAISYLKDNKIDRDETETIGIVDFGDQGLTFSINKLYFMEQGIVQCLDYSISKVGGLWITHMLVDYFVNELIARRGMDIRKDSFLMQRLKIYCQQAKHTLSNHQMAFIRLDGLPDIAVYGCEISLVQFQTCIYKYLLKNVQMISESINLNGKNTSQIILSGASCKIPLFQSLLKKQIPAIKIKIAAEDSLQQGLTLIKSGKVHVADICPFSLRMEADEKLAAKLIEKGEGLPVRIKKAMQFPSGELTYSMKFYQNDQLVATLLIPERPRQNRFSLYVQVDHNKSLEIYATTSQGLIRMNCNMMQIPREEYYRYEEILQNVDFHIETE